MHPHVRQTNAPIPASQPSARARRQFRAICRLREALFELQCAPEPDAVAIDALMQRLARVRARRADATA